MQEIICLIFVKICDKIIIGDNMASAVIHLCVAKKVNEHLKMDEVIDFLKNVNV